MRSTAFQRLQIPKTTMQPGRPRRSGYDPLERSLWATVALACFLGPAAVAQDLATVEAFGSGAEWTAHVPYETLVLTVSGEGYWVRTEFEEGARPHFEPYDEEGSTLPDGVYRWELLIVPRLQAPPVDRFENGRPPVDGSSLRQGSTPERQVASGSFWIQNGAVVGGGFEQEPEGSGATGGRADRGTDAPGEGPEPNFVVNDDLYVYNSACVGLDCVVPESFGADSIRLKENNLRIHFEDTSATAGFPSRDWRIIANDQASGGLDRFSIEDSTAGRIPFTIEGNAPANALYVDDGGRVGVGTATPVLDVHVVTGDTPALRLDQDGSSGFTPQVWDVAGNEANFFVRDVTHGSALPFKIQPGAPDSSLVVSSVGRVGVGTAGPASSLHVRGTSGTAKLQVEEASTTLDNNRVLVEIINKGRSQFRLRNTADASGQAWFVSAESNGNFGISRGGTGVLEVTVTPAGNMIIQGNYTPDYVFDPEYELMPLPELAEFVARERHLPNVPNAEQVAQEGINVNDFPMALLEKIEELTLYTIEQERTITQQQAALDRLSARLAAIEQARQD